MDNSSINGELQDNEETLVTSMEEDASSEATFDFNVTNFSQLQLDANVLSSPIMIHNLPWRILVIPKPGIGLGFFLQCNGESESSSWSCLASAQLIIVSQKEGVDNFTRKIQHFFYSKEIDWGFHNFMNWSDVVDPERGFIKDDTVILRARVIADAPYAVSCDPPKEPTSSDIADIGYVGLKNQGAAFGATRFMNSLLQALYFTNELRKNVYKVPLPSKTNNYENVTSALQRVFFDLQSKNIPVDAKNFIKLFTCETNCYAPHNVQKFVTLLLERLQWQCSTTVCKLFKRKMTSFVMLKNKKYVNEESDIFYNVELNVTQNNNIYEAFRELVPVGLDASESNGENAVKGVVFISFPPVLHILLKRFHHDPLTDCFVKFNDRFQFYEKLNLNPYLQYPEPEPTSVDYTLHAVLTHGGDYYDDQYVAFINPKADGKWYKFVDENVSKCSKQEAIENNYGGQVTDSSNAYMLVYIRNDDLKNILQDVTEEDIPNELKTRLEEERETTKVIDCYITMNVFREKSADAQPYNVKQSPIRIFRMKATTTIEQILTILSKSFNCPLDRIKMKPFNLNPNRTYECMDFEVDAQKQKQIGDIAKSNICNVFLEIVI